MGTIVSASRDPQESALGTPKQFCEEFIKMSISKYIIDFFPLNVIPITLKKDIMLYFNK